MGKTFFTSDLHLFHRKVAETRGFDTVEGHNHAVVQGWCETITPNDIVWVLGDLVGRESDTYTALGVIASLPGEKHLIAGNHDECWPGHRNSHKRQREYLDVFESVQPFAVRKLNGERVNLSHFPYEGDHTDIDRARQYRLNDVDGLPILHGHTHSSISGSTTASNVPQVHVGLDSWGMRPAGERQIIEELKTIRAYSKVAC